MRFWKRFTGWHFLLIAALLVACGEQEAEEQEAQADVRVAFVYAEDPAEYNWSYIHEVGRQQLITAFTPTEENKVEHTLETTVVDSVTPAAAEAAIRDLAEAGYQLIFVTAAALEDATHAVAEDFPETFFEVNQGSRTATNVSTYDGRMYQAFYLAGGFVGEMAISGIIGFIAPEPTVEVIRHINALTHASLISERCEGNSVHVRWTGWNDPEADRAAAEELIALGADIIVQHTYPPEVQKVAEEAGIHSVGYGFDMREFAPTANATSILWQWGWYYERRVNDWLEEEYEAQAYLGEVSTRRFGRGIVDFAPYDYVQIPHIHEATVMRWRSNFAESNRDALDGQIYAQNGDLVLARGEQFGTEYLYNEMDWFVFGVVGDAPGAPPTMVEGGDVSGSCS
ncbi:MAG: BMP family ABC transporter substrate-binding protein [Chloroflexi bacterium]|nr:BMP family ABC transporter substrate-binding protein [Chloroflexota bacterium]